MRHPNSERFHAILREHAELHDKKQADYGRGDDPFANIRASDEWGIKPWVGAMIRLNDKVRRLQGFALKGSLANESVEDSLRDIAVYATIALVLYEQEGELKQKTPVNLSALPKDVQEKLLRDFQTSLNAPSPDSSNNTPPSSDHHQAPLIWSENFPDRNCAEDLLGREIDDIQDRLERS